MDNNILIINKEDLRSIITDFVKEAILTQKETHTVVNQDLIEFGDMDWLYSIYPDSISKATIRHKSAMNGIPGKIKFGKRVLYNKSVVLEWLRSQSSTSRKLYKNKKLIP